MARPTKLTPAIAAKLVLAIRVGNYASVAAKSVGIDQSTYYDWLAKGREDKAPYAEFAVAIQKAEAEAEAATVARIQLAEAAPNTWQAAAWWLERRFPDRWGRRDRLEVEHTVVEREAKRLADEFGLDPAEVLREAEATVKRAT